MEKGEHSEVMGLGRWGLVVQLGVVPDSVPFS